MITKVTVTPAPAGHGLRQVLSSLVQSLYLLSTCQARESVIINLLAEEHRPQLSIHKLASFPTHPPPEHLSAFVAGWHLLEQPEEDVPSYSNMEQRLCRSQDFDRTTWPFARRKALDHSIELGLPLHSCSFSQQQHVSTGFHALAHFVEHLVEGFQAYQSASGKVLR